MYQIILKEQVLTCGVKVVKQEEKSVFNDLFDYTEALNYLNDIFYRVCCEMVANEKGFGKMENEIRSITRKSKGIVVVRFIDKKCTDIKRTYKIVKQY